MATKTGTTALATAMRGGKVTERQAQSALGQAVTKIANLTKKAESSKSAMLETGTLVLHTAETQGSLFLASMAEGFLGEDKLKVGSVDVRAPVSVLAQGYGLYQTIRGQQGAGAHVLALGNGIMGSWLATVARNAGRTLAEKRAGVASQGQAAQQPTVTLQGQTPLLTGEDLLPDPLLQGQVREVLLTPGQSLEGLDDRPRRRRRHRRGRGRFVRATHEDDELFDDEA